MMVGERTVGGQKERVFEAGWIVNHHQIDDVHDDDGVVMLFWGHDATTNHYGAPQTDIIRIINLCQICAHLSISTRLNLEIYIGKRIRREPNS